MYIIYSSEWQSYCNCTEEDKGSNHSNSGHPGILHIDISKLQGVTSISTYRHKPTTGCYKYSTYRHKQTTGC